MDCGFAQGFLLARPMTGGDLEAAYRRRPAAAAAPRLAVGLE